MCMADSPIACCLQDSAFDCLKCLLPWLCSIDLNVSNDVSSWLRKFDGFVKPDSYHYLPSSRSSTLLHPISITCHDLRLSTIRYLHPLDTFYRSAGLQNLWLHYPQRMQRIEMQSAATNFVRYRCTLDLQSMPHLCTSTLLGTNISYPIPKALLKMIFLFSRWDMLVPRRVYINTNACFQHFSTFFNTCFFTCATATYPYTLYSHLLECKLRC